MVDDGVEVAVVGDESVGAAVTSDEVPEQAESANKPVAVIADTLFQYLMLSFAFRVA